MVDDSADNNAPTANAGSDQTVNIGLAGGSTSMAGSGDDLDGDPLTYSWTVVSGPGIVTFGDETAANSTAHFDAIGTYVLRLTVTDGLGVGTADVTITAIVPNNDPPITDAGLDRTIEFTITPWTPNTAGALAWYDASDAGTLWADGGITPATSAVQRWDDKSGNGKHAVASGTKPTYTSGTSSVSGTSSTPMTLPNDLYASASSGCVVWVGTQDSGGGGWGNYGRSNNIHSPWTDNYMYSAFLSSGRVKATSPTSGLLGKQTIQSRVQTGTRLEMWSDGSQVYNAALTFDKAPTEAKFFDQGSYTLNEVVFLPDADLATREKAEGYLAHKWGLTDELPLDHPYRSVTPKAPGASVTLNGSVTDNEQTPTGIWSVVSGPGAVIFSDVNDLQATATFSELGTYELKLTGSDGYELTTDTVIITVTPPASNTPPVTNAGADQTLYFSDAGGPSSMILAPSDAIEGFQSTNGSDNTTSGGWWSPNEPAHAIDGNIQTKYAGPGRVGSGFYVTPAVGSTVLTGVRVTTANDVVGRDPLTISIEGSNGGDLTRGSSWTLIANNVSLGINSDPGRLSAGPLVTVSGSTAYTHYRIIVQSTRDAGADGAQYSEFELFGTTGGADTTLEGSVFDGEQTPTGTWSQISGPGSASLSDANALDSAVTFTEVGTYVYQLTGDDGFVQTTDTVTINVRPRISSIYQTWAASGFANSFANIEPHLNGDGDRKSSMMEFAFGTDPTLRDDGPLATDGSRHGEPTLKKGAGDVMEFYFVRRKDHGQSGSVRYTVQFSADLNGFTTYYDEANPPGDPIASDIDPANYEVVKVPFPAGFNFGRVEVDFVP